MSDEIRSQEIREAGPGAFPDAAAARELLDCVVAEARGSGVEPTFVLVIVGGLGRGKVPGGTSGMIAVNPPADPPALSVGLKSIKLRVIAGEAARVLATIRRGRA